MIKYFGIILSFKIHRFQQKILFMINQIIKKLVNNVNNKLNNLRNAIIRTKISENENPNKTVNIVEKSSFLLNNKKVRKFLRTQLHNSKFNS